MGGLAMGMTDERAIVLSNECVGPRLWLMTLKAPVIAENVKPGQFVHMRIPGMEAHVLRRPFSVYARSVQDATIDILYQAVGFGSAHMTTLSAARAGETECADGEAASVCVMGPVGRGWQPAFDVRHALLVGGGVGAAPLFMLCEQLVGQGVVVDVVLGAQTKDALVCRARYDKLLSSASHSSHKPHSLSCATDDGSFGHAGFCTSLVQEALERGGACGTAYDYVAVCGPEPLMKIVAAAAAEKNVPCEVSLERRMACGIGACLSCVVDTASGKKRACVDGPVFNACEVVW